MALFGLMLFALALLALAPLAQASKKVASVIGPVASTSTGVQGGFFSTPRGVAVNLSGNGPADVGDVYVVDGANHRIQQFDAEGRFIRAFGQDVIVATGPPPNSNGTGFEICDTTTVPANTPTECKAGITSAQTGGAMNQPQGIAIDQSDGSLYVTDQGNRRVQKFSADGTFNRAWGWDVTTGGVTTFEVCTVAAECKIAAAAGASGGQFAAAIGYPAVDPTSGNVYIADATNRRVQEFESDGTFVRLWGWDVVGVSEVQEIKVNNASSGTYTLTFDGATTDPIAFNATATTVQNALRALPNIAGANVNVTGASGNNTLRTRTITFVGDLAGTDVPELTADATGLNVGATIGVQTLATGAGGSAAEFEVCTVSSLCASGSNSVPSDEPGAFGTSTPVHLAIDSGGVLYVSDSAASNRVQRFDVAETNPADLLMPPIAVTAVTGTTNATTTGLAVDSSTGNLLVARGNAAIGVLELTDPSSATPTSVDSHLIHSSVGVEINVSPAGLGVNSDSGEIFFVQSSGAHRVFILDDHGPTPAIVTIDPPLNLEAHSASFKGSVNPDSTGLPVSYRFQYSKNGVHWTDVAPMASLGSGTDPISVSDEVAGLEANTFYRVRVVTQKPFGAPEFVSQELVFLTDAVGPTVLTFNPQRISDSTATLRGQINPENLSASYHFEYGETASYGSRTPVPDGNVSGGLAKQIYAEINDLNADTTYHVRLVATNSEGTTNGADVEFRTYAAVAEEGERAYEMVTPPFKPLRSLGAMGGSPHRNPNPGIASLDGEAVTWGNSVFPLGEDVNGAANGDKRVMRRTASGWTFETYNTLRIINKGFGDAGAPFVRTEATASSADFSTNAWILPFGAKGELIPSEGSEANRHYTRRTGTGLEGFTSWLSNPAQQSVDTSYESGRREDTTINDEGTAMARAGFFRNLAEDPDTVGEDDPSDQQDEGNAGGRTIYTQQAADPDDMPTAPKEVVNGCTGEGAEATLLPARIGTGVSTDTIGTVACETFQGEAAATGAATRTLGSATLTGVTANSGAFQIGQFVNGSGISGGSRITAVGSGTLTLSKSVACGGTTGSGTIVSGSPVITNVTIPDPSCGAEFSVGQVVTMPQFFGSSSGTITDVDTDARTVTVSPAPSGLAFTGAFGIPTGSGDISARGLSITHTRGASLGSGALGAGITATSMSNDGNRIFFKSPDFGLGGPSEQTSCATATGTNTFCPPQLFVRQYDSDRNATVRWISRAQGTGTQQIGQLASATFEGASKDGRYVYFRTKSPLLPTDPNGGDPITTGSASNNSYDLYRYELPEDLDEDPANGTLLRISGGPSGTADPSTNNSASAGPSAPIGGGTSLRFMSDSGERAYFLTTSAIADADETPARGAFEGPGGTVGNGTSTDGIRNLYLFDDSGESSPAWRFIARLPFSASSSASDGTASLNRCATLDARPGYDMFMNYGKNTMNHNQADGNCFRGTPDGRHALFFTAGRITADDTDDAGDIYYYNAERDELTRVSAPSTESQPYVCNADDRGQTFVGGVCNADFGVNLAGVGGIGSPATAGGPLETARGWAGGRYYNIAKGPDGVVSVFFASQSNLTPEDNDKLGRNDLYQWREGELKLLTPLFPEADYWFSGNSLNGQDVFFQTDARIDPREIDDADLDIYNLRVGGGFPYAPPPTPCDVLAHQCRSTALPLPAARGSATAGFAGAGNLEAKTAKRRCSKGKVRRGSRCVAKRALSRRPCAKRKGRAKQSCVRKQVRRLSQAEKQANRNASETWRASR